MSKMMENFRSSAKELKSTRNLTICAMLMALTIVISSFTIAIGNFLKIGFSFIASEIAYMLFGPVVGIVFGGAADILTYIVKPTGPFFYGFTISAIVGGFLYGLILYKKPISLWRIFFAKAVVMVVVNIGLTTYWLSLLYGKGFFVLLPARVTKNLIMLPINTLLFFAVVKILEKVKITQVHHGANI